MSVGRRAFVGRDLDEVLAAGQPLSALIDQIEAGNTYVNTPTMGSLRPVPGRATSPAGSSPRLPPPPLDRIMWPWIAAS